MRPDEFILNYRVTIAALFARGGASRWNIAEASFGEVLGRAVASRFPNPNSNDACDRASVVAFLESLYVEDLALAIACRAGNEAAWREFDAKFRSVIESIARALTRDVQRAREIVDSLYGDLYGFARGDGKRRSPLDYYHGRSPIAAWLRVVIAQREAEAWRVEYRAHPGVEVSSILATANHTAPEPDDPDRGRYLTMVADALRKSLDSLEARDRLRLSYYYVQELTLAETGALLGEHESTVSRHIARTRGEIRRAVEHTLRQEYRLSDDQISRCFEYATGDWPFDLARSLAQAR